MRALVRSVHQLAALRAAIRSDLEDPADPMLVVDDFVAAVNEVVAAAIDNTGYDPSIDVRWRRRTQPFEELYGEIRTTAGTPPALVELGIPSRLLHHYADRVDFEERIGGSMITVRCRV